MNNIILIGMAGCGKSTIGVLLAKALGYEFLDTDLVIQRREGELLHEILNKRGLEHFKEVEENALLSIKSDLTVIATGGSAVYSERAMQKLKSNGICIWLSLPFEVIESRINNISTRGIVIAEGMTLRDVYNERLPLYEKYADITIDCQGDVEATVSQVIERIAKTPQI